MINTAEKTRVKSTFSALAQEWKNACQFLSSTSMMIAHPAYQEIIKLGEPAVPLLLQELEREQAHWFEALQAITGEDPVSRDDWGNIPAMTAAWLAWGRSRNLL